MVSIGLYDTLLFTGDASQQTRLRCRLATTHAVSPQQQASLSGEDNLVLRAAHVLREETGCDRGVRIDLIKRIPLQAGLGGGSSDAAATLVGLNRFWELGLSSVRLHKLAARLGSDVNFFLDSPRGALCTGRGEDILPLSLTQRLHFVVACPAAGLSTAEVFRHWQPTGDSPHSSAALVAALQSGRSHVAADRLFNALQTPACGLNDAVARTLADLQSAGGAAVAMSGSGSSCFALCRSARQARHLAGRVGARADGWVFPVSIGA